MKWWRIQKLYLYDSPSFNLHLLQLFWSNTRTFLVQLRHVHGHAQKTLEGSIQGTWSPDNQTTSTGSSQRGGPTTRLWVSYSILPSLVNKIPRYLNFARGRTLLPTWLHPFPTENHGHVFWRCWFSTPPLHARPRPTPLKIFTRWCQQNGIISKKQKQSWGHQTRTSLLLYCF